MRLHEPLWYLTKDGDRTCLALYLRHYSSRKRRKGKTLAQFVGAGEHIVLRTGDGDAVFVWRNYIDDTEPPQEGIECSLFRNESPLQSSELVRQADAVADFAWPGERHYTKVNKAAVRSSNPGFCFMAAGWRKCGMTKGGLLILERDGLPLGECDPRDPDYTKKGIFILHNCWKCRDGELPCANGHTLNCEYPHARND